MTVEEQIAAPIAHLQEPKRNEIQELHEWILRALPRFKLWFFDGNNSDGIVIANHTIGYGNFNIK